MQELMGWTGDTTGRRKAYVLPATCMSPCLQFGAWCLN